MGKYKELDIWNLAMEIVTDVYETTAKYPKEELYGLTGHTRKTALSIPSNIAEGRGRKSDTDFNRFLNIAVGSTYELETQLELASRLEYISGQLLKKYNEKITLLLKQIQTLQQKLDK